MPQVNGTFKLFDRFLETLRTTGLGTPVWRASLHTASYIFDITDDNISELSASEVSGAGYTRKNCTITIDNSVEGQVSVEIDPLSWTPTGGNITAKWIVISETVSGNLVGIGTLKSDGTNLTIVDSANLTFQFPDNKAINLLYTYNSTAVTSIAGITGTKSQFNSALTDGNFAFTDDIPTSIAGITGTKSQFNSALTDGNFLFEGDLPEIPENDTYIKYCTNEQVINGCTLFGNLASANSRMYILNGDAVNGIPFFYSTNEGQTFNPVTVSSSTLLPGISGGRVAFGNSLWVAMGNPGLTGIWTSANGVDWTPIRNNDLAPNGQGLNCLKFINGLFFALFSNGSVCSSADGVTWTTGTTVSLKDIAFGNGVYVAVATSGTDINTRVYTSVDGITWVARTAAANNNWTAITFGNSIFVAVSTDGTSNRVMTSSDGITWTTQSTSMTTSALAGIAWNGSIFVAAGTSGSAGSRVITSPDGITWTARTQNTNSSPINEVVWLGGSINRFVIVATNYISSADGITWSTSNPMGVANLAFNGTTVIGLNARKFKYSTTAVASTEFLDGLHRNSLQDTGWTKIKYINGEYVAISIDNIFQIATSSDGITWTRVNLTGALANRVCNDIDFNGSNYVILMQGGTGTTDRIYTSTDKITWTARTTLSLTYNDLVWTGQNFVAATSNATSGIGPFAISADGTTWVSTGGITGATLNARSLFFDSVNNLLLAPATNSSVFLFVSTDHGATWKNALYNPSDIIIYNLMISSALTSNIVKCGSKYVALMSSNSLYKLAAAISSDGLIWDCRPLNSLFFDTTSLFGGAEHIYYRYNTSNTTYKIIQKTKLPTV